MRVCVGVLCPWRRQMGVGVVVGGAGLVACGAGEGAEAVAAAVARDDVRAAARLEEERISHPLVLAVPPAQADEEGERGGSGLGGPVQ